MDVKVMNILCLVFGIFCVTFVVSVPVCDQDNCGTLDCSPDPKGKFRDANHCPVCRCLSQNACPVLECAEKCLYGYMLNLKRCETCDCCPVVKCAKDIQDKCGKNLKKDATGCPYCVCA